MAPFVLRFCVVLVGRSVIFEVKAASGYVYVKNSQFKTSDDVPGKVDFTLIAGFDVAKRILNLRFQNRVNSQLYCILDMQFSVI